MQQQTSMSLSLELVTSLVRFRLKASVLARAFNAPNIPGAQLVRGVPFGFQTGAMVSVSQY